MKKIALIISSLFVSLLSFGQWTESPMAHCENADFNRKVNKMLNYSVDVISVSDLKKELDNYIILDARELEEYTVSRIPGAIHFGYDLPKWTMLDTIDKDKEVVVYCSIGYRSEKIGEQLIQKGYTNVRNLYGSIFEWANQGYDLLGPRERKTNKVHTYSKKWH